MATQPKMPIHAARSYRERSVAVRFRLKTRGFDGNSVSIDGSIELTSQQARGLALALTDFANASDARGDAKDTAEQRRKAWRDREVAAGRMKIFSFGAAR